MGNCFVDSCEQVQTRLDKKLTPKTLEANNLRRVMIIGARSVRQDWEDSYRNWNIIPGCINNIAIGSLRRLQRTTDSSSWMRGLTCRSASLGGLEAAIPGGGLRAIARASGGALCPAQRHRPGPVRVVRVGHCCGGDVSLPGFRVGPAARACPAESSKATAVCKPPPAANRKP
jgi:hypothetical protein